MRRLICILILSPLLLLTQRVDPQWLAAGPASGAQPPLPVPTAQWNFSADTSAACNVWTPSSSTTVYDCSGNGHPATLHGTDPGSPNYWYIAAHNFLPYQFNLDGSTNYASTSYNPGTGTQTLAAWVTPTNNTETALVTSVNASTDWAMYIYQIAATWSCGVVTTSPSTHQYNTTGPLTAGVAAFGSCVFDNTAKTLTLYVNGSYVSSISTGQTLRTSGPVYIGYMLAGSHFLGGINAIFWFAGTALTAPQEKAFCQKTEWTLGVC